MQGGWKDWKGWQHHYDTAADPWVTDDQSVEEVKGQDNKKPILQLFRNVVQSNADAAAAKAAAAAVDAMAHRATSDNIGAAGFPSPAPTPPPPPAKSSAPALQLLLVVNSCKNYRGGPFQTASFSRNISGPKTGPAQHHLYL